MPDHAPNKHASASNACAGVWDCHVHGSLPLHQFGKEDLNRKRHRCKRCLADKMAIYRKKQPLRHMWNCFVQCAQQNFGSDAVDGLSWTEHGQPLLSRLVSAALADAPLQQQQQQQQLQQVYKLAWEQAEELDLQRVHLVRKKSKRQRTAETDTET